MRDYLELTKPRITLLILICTAVGYTFGCGGVFHIAVLVHALAGTALLASGTSALNQWYEVESDAKMRRTRLRPLPAGRLKRSHGLLFGILLSAAGFGDKTHSRCGEPIDGAFHGRILCLVARKRGKCRK